MDTNELQAEIQRLTEENASLSETVQQGLLAQSKLRAEVAKAKIARQLEITDLLTREQYWRQEAARLRRELGTAQADREFWKVKAVERDRKVTEVRGYLSEALETIGTLEVRVNAMGYYHKNPSAGGVVESLVAEVARLEARLAEAKQDWDAEVERAVEERTVESHSDCASEMGRLHGIIADRGSELEKKAAEVTKMTKAAEMLQSEVFGLRNELGVEKAAHGGTSARHRHERERAVTAEHNWKKVSNQLAKIALIVNEK